MCENNWVRKIARVTRADRRRMVELREETGEQRSLTERLVRSRLQWAGHVEMVADDRLPNRAAELREQGRRRRGRPMLLICIGPRRGCQGRRPEPKTMDDSKQTANWGRSVQSIHEEVGTGGQCGM